MLKAQTFSAEVQKTVDNIFNEIQRLNISREPNRVLAAYLYSQREEADPNVINGVKEYADLLKETFFHGRDEMAVMFTEYKQVIQYCLSKPVMDKYNKDRFFSLLLSNSNVELCRKLARIQEGSSILVKSTEQPNLVTGLSDLPCKVQICSNQWAFMQILSDTLDASTRMIIDNRISPIEEIDCQCKYDYIFSVPPIYPMRQENELLPTICEQIEHSLSEKGELYCFLPITTVFMQAHHSFRKRLVDAGYALTVIHLPIHTGERDQPMILLKVSKKHHDIMLVDTEYLNLPKTETQTSVEKILCAIENKDERFVWVGNKDMLCPDLCLRASKYLAKNIVQPQKGEKVISLEEIITLFTHNRKKARPDQQYKSVSMNCLSLSYLNCNLDFDSLKTEKTSPTHTLFNEDCIILDTFMYSVRIGRITNSFGREYAMKRRMIPFKMKKSALKFITEDFLLKSLMNESTLLQIYALSNQCIDARMEPDDFLSIRIAVPSLKEQETLVKADVRKSMSDSEKKLEDMLVSYKKEISSRKHRIGQGFGALSANWDILNAMMDIHGGHLDKKDVVDPDSNLTVDDIFEAMKRQINLIGYQIDHLSDVDFDFGKVESVVPDTFIHQYIETHRDTRFTFEENYNLQKYEDYPVGCKIKLKIARKAMETVFDNIISNAIAHGFTDSNRKDYKIKFEESFVDVDKYEIRISNNGNPLPSDINPEDIFLYGFSTASQEENHSGIGCADCRSILEKYKATISVTSTPTEDFTLTFCITFHQNLFNGE